MWNSWWEWHADPTEKFPNLEFVDEESVRNDPTPGLWVWRAEDTDAKIQSNADAEIQSEWSDIILRTSGQN